MQYGRGFGLIELCIGLAIVGILLLWGLPTVQYYMEQTRAEVRIMQLYHTLNFSRQVALSRHQRVIICPTQDQHHCQGDWINQLMVFADENNDHQRAETEPLLRLLVPNTRGNLTWQGFGATQYIAFLPYGWHNQQNGTFLYCSPSRTVPMAKGLIISKSGRIRLATVVDNHQIVDGSGHILTCTGS